MNTRIDDLIALAALGELSEQESTELDAAARADPVVAEELAQALASAAAIQASPIEHPPPALRSSVLDAIAGLAQDPPAATDAAEPDATPAEPVEHGDTARRDPGRGRRFAPLLAAAAVLLVVVGGALVVTDRDGGEDPIAAVVEADDATATTLTGEMGELEMWYSPDQQAVVLIGDALAPVPEGSTYQVWLVAESGAGSAASVGTFEPTSEGTMAMRADGVDPAGSVMKITMEPAGGSPQPTGPLMASV
jgi:anti-sigma-K factor RskA